MLLYMLAYLRRIYSDADIVQKREFVKLVLDSNLYYQEGIYRTPTMLFFLTHNNLKMKGKGSLELNKKRGMIAKSSLPVGDEVFKPPKLR